MRAEESLCIAALFQAIVKKLWHLLDQNLGFRLYRRALIAENKWRAARYGIHGKLIDFGKQEEVEFRYLMDEILDFINEEVEELGSRKEIDYVHELMETGTGADRQLKVWEKNHSGREVVDYIIEETYRGLSL